MKDLWRAILLLGILSISWSLLFAIDIPTPQSPQDPYAGLSPIELSKRGDEAYNAGRFDEAEKIYAALLKAIPDDPVAKQKVQELKDRRQQAEAESKRKTEMADKLKNADYFLLKGDEVYKAGDYSTAASYYIKVAEVDVAFKDAGVKYWLSKAKTAILTSDTPALLEAWNKLKSMIIPDSLKADYVALSPLPGEVKVNPVDGLEYVYIPPGSFIMGCVNGDPSCLQQEKPSYEVKVVQGFWICKTETTIGAYKKYCSSRGKTLPVSKDYNANLLDDSLPITNVSWEDASGYCTWAGGKLPKESEWEYSARAGTSSYYYWGNYIDSDYAWYNINSGKFPHSVGEKKPNSFGLYDMLGNVHEWCSDWYRPNYYNPVDLASGQEKVLRGGSVNSDLNQLRASWRLKLNPSNRYDDLGFRCVLDPMFFQKPIEQVMTPSTSSTLIPTTDTSVSTKIEVDYSKSLVGKYMMRNRDRYGKNADDLLVLLPDGKSTFTSGASGTSIKCNWKVEDNILSIRWLILPPDKYRIEKDILIGIKNNVVWEKQEE